MPKKDNSLKRYNFVNDTLTGNNKFQAKGIYERDSRGFVTVCDLQALERLSHSLFPDDDE